MQRNYLSVAAANGKIIPEPKEIIVFKDTETRFHHDDEKKQLYIHIPLAVILQKLPKDILKSMPAASPGKYAAQAKPKVPVQADAPVPAKDSIPRLMGMIPPDVALTDRLQELVRCYCTRSGFAYAERNIRYTNAHIKDKSKYQAYLDKCLKADWGKDMVQAQEIRQKAEVRKINQAVAIVQTAQQENTDALRKMEERERMGTEFMRMSEQERERIRQAYLQACSPWDRRKSGNMKHAALSRYLGFRIFLEKGGGNAART